MSFQGLEKDKQNINKKSNGLYYCLLIILLIGASYFAHEYSITLKQLDQKTNLLKMNKQQLLFERIKGIELNRKYKSLKKQLKKQNKQFQQLLLQNEQLKKQNGQIDFSSQQLQRENIKLEDSLFSLKKKMQRLQKQRPSCFQNISDEFQQTAQKINDQLKKTAKKTLNKMKQFFFQSNL